MSPGSSFATDLVEVLDPDEHVEQPRQVLFQYLPYKTAIPTDLSTTHVGLASVWDLGTTSTRMLNIRC